MTSLEAPIVKGDPTPGSRRAGRGLTEWGCVGSFLLLFPRSVPRLPGLQAFVQVVPSTWSPSPEIPGGLPTEDPPNWGERSI